MSLQMKSRAICTRLYVHIQHVMKSTAGVRPMR